MCLCNLMSMLLFNLQQNSPLLHQDLKRYHLASYNLTFDRSNQTHFDTPHSFAYAAHATYLKPGTFDRFPVKHSKSARLRLLINTDRYRHYQRTVAIISIFSYCTLNNTVKILSCCWRFRPPGSRPKSVRF